MKKYTLKTIKQTICYRSNIEAIKAIYPNHWQLFARELMIAANATSDGVEIYRGIASTFNWASTPQGYDAWSDICNEIFRYRNRA